MTREHNNRPSTTTRHRALGGCPKLPRGNLCVPLNWNYRYPTGARARSIAAATPAIVIDAGAREIASFRSPRKLGKALVSGELVLVAGDVIHIGRHRVVS